MDPISLEISTANIITLSFPRLLLNLMDSSTVRDNQHLAKEFLYNCIEAIPVTHDQCLDHILTIENMQRDTHVILSPINDTGYHLIKMPFFFLCIYNDFL